VHTHTHTHTHTKHRTLINVLPLLKEKPKKEVLSVLSPMKSSTITFYELHLFHRVDAKIIELYVFYFLPLTLKIPSLVT
jgi:hypothetical protein